MRPPVAEGVNVSVLPEQTGPLLLMVTEGLVLTVTLIAFEAVMQLLLDKLATSGPTSTL